LRGGRDMARIEPGRDGIAFTEAGSGQPVVLLHASASSSAQWQDLIRALEGQFRVLAPDLYGHGGSAPWRGPEPLTLADEAAIITALADHAGEPVHLAGHSYGAAVALRFAQAYPERLRSLVLIEPAAFHLLRENSPDHAASLAEIEGLAGSVTRAAGDAAGDMRHFVDFWNAVLGCTTPLDAYAVIRTPTLIVRGSLSPAPMSPIIEALTGVLPQARMLCVSGAGHMLPITHAESVNPGIVGHLNDAAKTPPLRLRPLDGPDFNEVSRHLLALGQAERHVRFVPRSAAATGR
jgi:pimeloyl-ACP methyl ester carboxylesterase